ncbi:MAG: pseudouridine synthase [Spirochaetia bacterium]|nr:pseudouridine synthase [Spirochaetia bacterium]
MGARRDVERYILAGRVEVSGRVVKDLAFRISRSDTVRVDGQLIKMPENKYYVMNKPVGVICSHRRFGEDKILADYLPEELKGLKYAGRLDRDTRGLVVLSTDGAFLNAIAHPTRRLTKKYLVKVEMLPTEKELARSFYKGIEDEGDILRAHSVHIRDRQTGIVEVVLGEGKNRQIRRMFESLGLNVLDLFRVAVGFYDLEKEPLAEGQSREVDPNILLYGDGK